jgi:hypothetical protein
MHSLVKKSSSFEPDPPLADGFNLTLWFTLVFLIFSSVLPIGIGLIKIMKEDSIDVYTELLLNPPKI